MCGGLLVKSAEFQCDLADMQGLKRYNKGFGYCLVAVDPMSRQMFAVPAKTKSTKDMKIAFDELFKKIKPSIILTDKGTEFMAKQMQEFFKNNGIEHHHPETDGSKASFAEERIGVLKRRLYKYFAAKNTLNWTNVTDLLCTAINNSYCRSINMTPNSVNSNNWFDLWKKLYGSKERENDKTYYKIGDLVRVRIKRNPFSRSYHTTYSDEVFDIVKINDSNPKTFEICDYNGERIIGKYYKEELSLADKSGLFRIEKVIKTRIKDGQKELFVKFFGDPRRYWVQE